MIIKCLSVKSNQGIKNLIRYIMAEKKIAPQSKSAEQYRPYVPGLMITGPDLRYLRAEAIDSKILDDFKTFNGTFNEFIESQSAAAQNIDGLTIKQNIRARSIQGYIKAFEENEKLRLRHRADSVKAYHNIISFNRLDTKHVTNKMLNDIAERYISLRGPTSLFLGAVHQDKDHLHIHLIQSGVQCGTGKASRISRQEFQEVKRTLQEYQKDKYPELVHSLPEHGKSKNLKLNDRGIGEKYKPNERESNKKELVELLGATLTGTTSWQHLMGSLAEKGAQPYFRNGRPQGVIYEDRKYRFSTLGVKEQIEKLAIMNAKEEKELKELQQLRGRGKSRLAEIEKLEKGLKDSNLPSREMHQEVDKAQELSHGFVRGQERVINYDKMCDDCKMERKDPGYENPKFYDNGKLDAEKLINHLQEEFANAAETREYVDYMPELDEEYDRNADETAPDDTQYEIINDSDLDLDEDNDLENDFDRDDDDFDMDR